MKPFTYLRDPLFVSGCALYALNRWFLKLHFSAVVLHSWFNDALLIPCALPPVLLFHRWLGLRSHDRCPTAGELVTHLVGWAILFEGIGPAWVPGATGDPWDVMAYGLGTVIAALWWNRPRLPRPFRIAP